MSYEILSDNGKYWTCHQLAWKDYLKLATAFGWAPEGAFFKCDEGGLSEHPSGSYLFNDWQMVTDDDARAMAAALNLAIAVINSSSPMTDNQVTALKEFEIACDDEPILNFMTPSQQTAFLGLKAQYLTAHPDEVRCIRTRNGSFDINMRGIMDLAEVVGDGGFTIA